MPALFRTCLLPPCPEEHSTEHGFAGALTSLGSPGWTEQPDRAVFEICGRRVTHEPMEVQHNGCVRRGCVVACTRLPVPPGIPHTH